VFLTVFTSEKNRRELRALKTAEKKSPKIQRRAYSVKEIADMVGRHPLSIYRAIYRGELHPISGFGITMISERELERFLSITR
jgi:hypothetical protein